MKLILLIAILLTAAALWADGNNSHCNLPSTPCGPKGLQCCMP